MKEALGLRGGFVVLVFLACVLLERALPRRRPVGDAATRWGANLGLMVLGWLVAFALPFAATGAAWTAEEHRWGLLNLRSIWLPAKIALSVVLLDLVVYLQHRLFHAVPWLWRAHAVHHTDLDLDATSGLRFHPVELALSTAIKAGAAAFLGLHFLGVALFEGLLAAGSIFSHSNLDLGPLDRVARLLVVTPDMHRIHHSPSREETDSNFGFFIPWWDRLFGTYRRDPREDHATMTLGLDGAREDLGFVALVARPFRSRA